ncbi:hypothetical protein DH2020_034108 [Rehmannia glutinosa]|uniref:F-box domain-containing protein n=1 Tax=Rehmannia glutinosa TaxID=99300 RepID=A0ABR0VAB3_REHGL
MGTLNRKAINPIDRYQALGLKESLSKPSLYVFASKELSSILRNAYSASPKNLQSLIFQDTLFAFSLLPELQTQYAISAANSLLQSAEFAFPKQKRALAVTEYKHAVVASKRKSKTNQEEEGLTLLPQDALVHIFSFLDVQSLVSASAVCWSWNTAARDNHLWKSLYAIFFYNSDNFTKHSGFKMRGVTKNGDKIHPLDDIGNGVGFDWKCAFKTAFKETCYRKFKTYRGYCSSCCAIVWLRSNKCSNELSTKVGINHQIMPISTQQIVDYVLYGGLLSESSLDSDSDTEDVSVFKLWAYPQI